MRPMPGGDAKAGDPVDSLSARRTIEDTALELAFEVGLRVEGLEAECLRVDRHRMGSVGAGGERLVDELAGLRGLLGDRPDGALEGARSCPPIEGRRGRLPAGRSEEAIQVAPEVQLVRHLLGAMSLSHFGDHSREAPVEAKPRIPSVVLPHTLPFVHQQLARLGEGVEPLDLIEAEPAADPPSRTPCVGLPVDVGFVDAVDGMVLRPAGPGRGSQVRVLFYVEVGHPLAPCPTVLVQLDLTATGPRHQMYNPRGSDSC